MKDIILVAINSRYTHTAIGLRYLYANLHELQDRAEILEFVINSNPQDIAEKILDQKPKIVGIGTYIWNALDVANIIEIIKKISPDTKILLGGPEVSHFPLRVNFDVADHIISGEGEVSFYEICRDILSNKKIENRFIRATLPKLKELTLPYKYYTQHDIENRYMYVEASRGCPYECEFCLSAIDEKVRNFDMDILLNEFDVLWEKGARKFKFIDRTFNLNIRLANKLMDFFLSKDEEYSLHFEVIPDNFPPQLRERLCKFPPNSLQLEIGIQSLNLDVLDNINRKMNLTKVSENISFLENETSAHLHVDLIVGLPSESLESFGKNLNQLKKITNSEIQIGILKKLSGTTLSRHDKKYGMIYSDKPPYDILQNDLISFKQIQKMKRFARFWDLTYNSGNFYHTVNYIYEDGDVFGGFYNYSEWIYQETESTWQISLNRLSQLVFKYLTEVLDHDKTKVADSLIKDIIKIRGRSIPDFLRENATSIPDLRSKKMNKANKRQLLRSS